MLIANRGEIAMRIIRTCRRLGIETVLAASAPDRDSLPARLADRTVCIGPARAADSYLRVETIVQAALGVGAQAVHPGYGFLAERPALARLCEAHGLVFIGPTAAQIEAVGDAVARCAAAAAGVRAGRRGGFRPQAYSWRAASGAAARKGGRRRRRTGLKPCTNPPCRRRSGSPQ